MYEDIYERITDALVQYGYIVIEDALDETLTSELLAEAKEEQNYKLAGVSTASAMDANRRRDKIHWIEAKSETTQEFLDFINGLREYLNRSLYLGLSYYEAHFARYEKGDFYEKHLDAFKNSKNRVVTTVYYLNEEWHQEDGGELLICDEDSFITKVLPRANTLVVFMSEDFPHEVLPAKKERYSIAGWYRIDKF
ncbi:MAG: 2OG-Fe(II) oxygenase [Epsilonproteobacteria bacterium]|nr:2OG-Fe(II) oxygenase [Campylobacterota bacterium]